jgi:hypothetical protein
MRDYDDDIRVFVGTFEGESAEELHDREDVIDAEWVAQEKLTENERRYWLGCEFEEVN